MNAQQLSEWLSSISIADRIRALALVYSRLTVCSRELFLPERIAGREATVVAKLKGLNELHHKIAGQLIGYAEDPEKTYPVEVFSRIVFETSDKFEIRAYLNSAIEFARSRNGAGAGQSNM